ncbi:MAG: biotin/lipoyl-containing protein [Desulfomonilaceae bacterium]
MEYNLRVHDAAYRIEADPLDKTGRAAVSVDGETKQMVWTAFSEYDLSIDIDGQRMNASFARTGQGVWVWLEGRARFVQDASQQRRRKRADEVIPSEVTPPTPAVVVRVLVNVGDVVAKGQGLVVVSAMKMEITLCAPYAGTVVSINTSPGSQVKPGDILVEIDRATEE